MCVETNGSFTLPATLPVHMTISTGSSTKYACISLLDKTQICLFQSPNNVEKHAKTIFSSFV
jgi:hypothetical protein